MKKLICRIETLPIGGTMIKRTVVAAAFAFAGIATSVSAATVASGTTKVGDTDGIVLDGTGVSQAANTFSGFAFPAGRDWVWNDEGVNGTPTFTFSFDMTGFDLNSVILSGAVLVDNTVDVLLNGTSIFALPNMGVGNFESDHSFNETDSSLFLAGENILTFNTADFGGAWGFNAQVEVTADASAPSPVPLPAGLPLLLAGFGGLAVLRRARQS